MDNKTSSNGIGLLGWSFIALLVLKLIPGTVVHDWSWWLVTLPLWIAPAVILAIVIPFVFIWLFIKFFKWAHYG